MKLKSNLTKRYYFPIVEGSNYGYVFSRGATYNAFVTYIRGVQGVTKVTNYSQIWHWFAKSAVSIRQGYHMSWWKESWKIVQELSKANKYLNRQYNRMDKHIRNGDLDKATAVWRILHRRSYLWRLVLIVRKLPFLTLNILRVKSLERSVKGLMKKESYNLKFKRVFLKEYNSDGSLKKLRPLGVPSMEWRVIAASYEFLLVNLWARDWSKNQYACMPKVGVADAWIEILKRLSTQPIRTIIGFDLNKFFDTVWNANVTPGYYRGSGHPILEWLAGIKGIQPKVRPQDRKIERERTKSMRQIYANMTKGLFNWKDERQNSAMGFPQGLNVSPILSCKVLQDTKVLEKYDLIQYVDDGIAISVQEINPEEFITQLESDLNEVIVSGLSLNKSKTEIVMTEGIWRTPLKFLGCSYDGRTFKAHTRKGEFEVKDANKRIEFIINWLQANRSLLGGYRKLLTSLISEGWNPPKSSWTSTPAIKPPWKEIVMDFSTFWEETRAKVERLPINCVEVMSIETLGPKLGPVISSSNVQTMIGSFYLLHYLRISTVKRRKLLRGSTSWENILLKSRYLQSDW